MMQRAYLKSFSSFRHDYYFQHGNGAAMMMCTNNMMGRSFSKFYDRKWEFLEKRNAMMIVNMNRHQREFHTTIGYVYNIRKTSDDDVFEIMKQKGVHGRKPLTNLFSGTENSKVVNETKVTLSEDDARKLVEKMVTLDPSIDKFRTQVEECAGLHDRTERVNSILWEMKKQGKQPDFAMKLLINDVLEGKQPRKRYDEVIFNSTNETKEITNEEQASTMTFVHTEQIEKFTGVKPGENHGHKSNSPPPVQTEKNFLDKDFFEPIKAALSKTRRETEESIRSIFKDKFNNKDKP
ncbi:hypothetical protein C9374_013898 [Naegleria lovaniensis]|uniref:Uncharacterized protein n=1 Tax=Naegleria lovaniensis TaxID=51637 RepID=A0AA88H1K8_NAELO|nr:uncharacterized protein C9374_013898 [Naegleria lovaniensis]KAG2389338.1 hypothetical protein C9374_013898 [Naegleria lovaniensis]